MSDGTETDCFLHTGMATNACNKCMDSAEECGINSGRASKKASIVAMLDRFIARGIETGRDRVVISTIRAVRDYIERDEDERGTG